jgi:hypothetical protein
VVITDNLRCHKVGGIREAVEAAVEICYSFRTTARPEPDQFGFRRAGTLAPRLANPNR